MSTKALLLRTNLIVPSKVVITRKRGGRFIEETVNPTDLTSKANVYWLYHNLDVANRTNPALPEVKRQLRRLLRI